MLRPTVSRSVLVSYPMWDPRPDSCGFVDVGLPFWGEDGSVVYNCCWFSPAQLFSGPSPAGLMTIFYCLRFETPQIWRAGSPYLFPRKSVAQLYLQALGSLLVASYDSHGYGGGIRTHLHAWVTIKVSCTPFRTKSFHPFVVGRFWFTPLQLSKGPRGSVVDEALC
jgi:hypothetical protein